MVVAGTVIVCEIAPASDQLTKVYCVPPVPCGVLVAIVCCKARSCSNRCGSIPFWHDYGPNAQQCTVGTYGQCLRLSEHRTGQDSERKPSNFRLARHPGTSIVLTTRERLILHAAKLQVELALNYPSRALL